MARERLNGSKQLQMLSGTHYATYWTANYLFDLVILLINISSMVFILKMVDLSKNDPTSEVNSIAGSSTLGYFFLVLLLQTFSWCALAYFWSFYFKSDIIAFVGIYFKLEYFILILLIEFFFYFSSIHCTQCHSVRRCDVSLKLN